MHRRSLRRSLTLAMVGALAFAGVASADAVRADGDTVTPGIQTGTIDLGQVAPGATVAVPVDFELRCAGTSHADVGQTVTLTLLASSAPAGGQVVSVTPGEVGPVPDGWVPDGTDCPARPPAFTGTPSVVTLRAPTTPNVGYTYTVGFTRTLAPAGNDDGNALPGTPPSVSFRLAVVANAAPVLTLPSDMTVEGDTTGGWTAAYPGVDATDAEDTPDPIPTCDPMPGGVLPLGTTTVTCSVTDSGGRSASGTFNVTVVDTAAPTIAGMPGDQNHVASDPAGLAISFAPPTASDIVDESPGVSCAPASGSVFAPGSTTVTCTASDDSGNSVSASFVVGVSYVAPPSEVDASVVWYEPIRPGTLTFSAHRGRTIPVKAKLLIDGVVQTRGRAELRVLPCGGGSGPDAPDAVSRPPLDSSTRHDRPGRSLPQRDRVDPGTRGGFVPARAAGRAGAGQARQGCGQAVVPGLDRGPAGQAQGPDALGAPPHDLP